MRRGGIDVRLATLGDDLVTGANGITIQADTSIDNISVDDFDMMVLPGGWDGTYALADDERVQNLLKTFKEKKIVGAMCAAPYALKKAGILPERYTAYPGAVEEIDHPGYVSDEKVVEEGNVITSQGPGTAVCFGLAIVRRLVGEETAQQIKEGMLLSYC